MRFVTLGPEGTCHENAVRRYLGHHGLAGAEIELFTDLLEALERVHDGKADYLVACSAYTGVHVLTEKYHESIRVADTFLYPTKELVLLERTDVAEPRSLGLVKATEGYLGDIRYPEIVYEASKPIIGVNLVAGKYDAGLTHMEHHTLNPGRFRVRKYMGPVLTTWLVFGRHTAFEGDVRGVAPLGFYAGRAAANH